MTRRSAAASTVAVESPLLTAREAMAYLRRGRTFMTEHAAELGARRVGSRLMFARTDLDSYLERCRVRSVTLVSEPSPAPIPIVQRAAPSDSWRSDPFWATGKAR